MEFILFKKPPFSFHEVYPEIIFWSNGDIVKIALYNTYHKKSNAYISSGDNKFTIIDIECDGTILLRNEYGQNYIIKFESRISSSMITVSSSEKYSYERKIEKVINPKAENRSPYAELLCGIRDAMGVVLVKNKSF